MSDRPETPDRRLFWWGNRLCTYGRDLVVGDDLQVLGRPLRIATFADYNPTRLALAPEPGWRIADDVKGDGCTIEPRGWYEILPWPGEEVPVWEDHSGTWGVRYTDAEGACRVLYAMVSEKVARGWETDLPEHFPDGVTGGHEIAEYYGDPGQYQGDILEVRFPRSLSRWVARYIELHEPADEPSAS